ncbi:hypothetical protein VTK56DRAFT_2824 [Thermocarpiscus australiensis]
MQISVATILAFASAVLAQTEGFDPITKPTKGEEVPAGSTYEIVWEPSAAHPSTVSIDLLGGADPGHLVVLDTIAASIDGESGSYSWNVDSSLGSLATYGLKLTLDSDPKTFQYSFPFKIVGGGEEQESSTSSGTDSATATETETASRSSKTSSVTRTKSINATESATSSVYTPTSSLVSSTICLNVSTSATGGVPTTTITSFVTQQPSATRSPTTTTSAVTGGAASLAAGSFALFGGVAMAVLAL